ncbi:hypothetical protein ACHAXA_001342 [Cyclostephanos tholiformis]|uniref:Uncharacterized protein n=1 Tax=Cyclostephanos tholiformis TaxID=382380 RepID=A0ABD3REJ0_9STRA
MDHNEIIIYGANEQCSISYTLMESNEGMNSANNNFVSGVGIDVSVNSRASNLPKYESLRPSPESTVVGDTTSSSTAKSVLAPETPRWRFVNKAKKTEGYSSSAAGTYVKGISSRELVDKNNVHATNAPGDESKQSVDAGNFGEGRGGGEDSSVGYPGRKYNYGKKGDEGQLKLFAKDEQRDENGVVFVGDVFLKNETSLNESAQSEGEMLEVPTSHVPMSDPSSYLRIQQPSVRPEQTEEYYGDIPPFNVTASSQNKSSKKGKSARQVGGAAVAGTVAGLVVAGPIVGVAAGGAAAYTAARVNNPLGAAARKSGEAVACAGDMAKEVNDKHEITKKTVTMAKSAMQTSKKLEEKHRIVASTKKMANILVEKAKEIDEKYHVAEKSKDAANKAVATARNVEEKYQSMSWQRPRM